MMDQMQHTAIEMNLKLQKEIVRRKLDFDVIKDNHDNRVTQAILDRFTDMDQGMPGTNFKHAKIRELIKERHNQLEPLRQEQER